MAVGEKGLAWLAGWTLNYLLVGLRPVFAVYYFAKNRASSYCVLVGDCCYFQYIIFFFF